MIDLSTNPFNLNDEQIQKVTKICNDMTLDEKIEYSINLLRKSEEMACTTLLPPDTLC